MDPAPKTLLFLGCDLVGSTAFKQTNPENWPELILDFYWSFPQTLRDERALVIDEWNLDNGGADVPTFTLWKAIGDELVFTVDVTCEAQTAHAVHIWLRALQRFESDTPRASRDYARLKTKGAAFIGVFPNPDVQVAIPRVTETLGSDVFPVALNLEALTRASLETYQYDYCGPSIDTGFRVSSHASQRWFTLSAEVALLMIRHARALAGKHETEFRNRLAFLGFIDLKGVWGDREYPLFAIDREHNDQVNKLMREFQKSEISLDKALELLEACLADENWRGCPYLPKSQVEKFKVAPGDVLAPLLATAPTVEGYETDARGVEAPAEAAMPEESLAESLARAFRLFSETIDSGSEPVA